MKKTIQSKGFWYMLLPGIAVVAATMVTAADTPSADGYSVATSAGDVTVTSGGAAVTVIFEAQVMPASTAVRCDLLVGGSDPSNVFSGNLGGTGYSGIRFKITGTGQQPEDADVKMRIIDSVEPLKYHDWYYSGVTVSSQPGEWTIADVPLQRSAGWTTARAYRLSAVQLDALWTADLAKVSAMYVSLQAGGFVKQSYSLSDFRLMGAGVISEPANLTPLQHYFGVDSLDGLTDEELATLMAQDQDQDGMSDYNEILAGFDPRNAASFFATRLAAGTGRNTISWDGVLGKTYAVWRSNDLIAGFLPLVEGIQCTATGVMTIDDNSPEPGKANFYKVVNY